MHIKKVLGILVCVVALASAINLVQATTGSIWTTADSAGEVYASEFGVGQTVYIWWSTSPPEAVNIEILDSGGVLVVDLGPYSSQPATWVPTAIGIYYITIPGVGVFPIAISSILVVPESVLGTVMATVAGFAAFGTLGVLKYRRVKSARVHT